MNLAHTKRALATLHVQGAENVTTVALTALEETIAHSHAHTQQKLLQELEHAAVQLFKIRPTEPEMRNYCNAVIFFLQEFPGSTVRKAQQACTKYIQHLRAKKEERKERLTKIGELFLVDQRKEKELFIFTHCHSSTVTSIIKKVNKRKNVHVFNTETRPLFQGRITAQELAHAGIPVTHFVDAAMKQALQQADIILIGADAITHDAVYNKIGSGLLAQIAHQSHIPLYVCATFWKYEPHREILEQRSPQEIWEHAPKGIDIENPAFEKIPFKHVKKIICEEGVLSPREFLNHTRKMKRKNYLYP